jgi:hypothetical protein
MPERPSILVLDDGELDNVYQMLVELELDAVRLKGPEIKRSVEAPRDLLISAGRRTLGNMPEVIQPEGATEKPTWVCVHNQDFLPMRQRLCERGVHYLLLNALDEDSRRRFLLQLLRAGGERRRNQRLPLGEELWYRADGDDEAGRLVELSIEGCLLLASGQLEVGSSVTLLLPPSLAGGSDVALSGNVLRRAEPESHAGRVLHPTVLRFEGLEAAQTALLESIVQGERIGTRITALAERPEAGRPNPIDPGPQTVDVAPAESTPRAEEGESASEPEEGEEGGVERRRERRHDYEGKVQVLGEEDRVLARDLSMTGVRLTGRTGLEEGAEVTVALFGAPREEPIVVSAHVVRVGEHAGAALRFGPMSEPLREALAKILRSQPILDALDGSDPEAGRTVVAELRQAAG